jgi:uncharacterized protein (DUF302 family)
MAAGRRHPAEEQTMATDTTVRVMRHTLTTQKPCDARIGALEARADRNLPAHERRARVEDLIGSSGFVLCLEVQHDHLFAHCGRPPASVQYAIGHPLIPKDVSDKAPASCLYTPFRLAVYESPETHETIVSDDSPASLFGAFGVPVAAEIGATLEGKRQDLLHQCLSEESVDGQPDQEPERASSNERGSQRRPSRPSA